MNKYPENPENATSGNQQQQGQQPQSPQPIKDKKANEKKDQGPISDQDYSSSKNQSGKNTDPDSED